MAAIRTVPVPSQALLQAYGAPAGYADCFTTDLPQAVHFADFIEAFYTSPLFKVERAMLGLFASRPSSDRQARQLSTGQTSSFAAWTVEGRSPNQLLLADFTGRTRSWLMAEPLGEPAGASGTRLYFGSAVVPRRDRRSGRQTMGAGFHALLGFHKLYSRSLLRAAVSRLASRGYRT